MLSPHQQLLREFQAAKMTLLIIVCKFESIPAPFQPTCEKKVLPLPMGSLINMQLAQEKTGSAPREIVAHTPEYEVIIHPQLYYTGLYIKIVNPYPFTPKLQLILSEIQLRRARVSSRQNVLAKSIYLLKDATCSSVVRFPFQSEKAGVIDLDYDDVKMGINYDDVIYYFFSDFSEGKGALAIWQQISEKIARAKVSFVSDVIALTQVNNYRESLISHKQ